MTIRALAGDLDLVGGEESGKLIYLENTGSSRTPEFVERIGTANPFDGIDVGVYSAPALGDLDGDGDLDLVVGEESGKLIYIENTGTSTEPEFAEFVAFLDFSPKSSYSYSYSYLYDDDYVDDDYVPTMPPSRQGNYSNLFAGIDVGYESIPVFADLDGDGDLDLAVGNLDGKLNYIENTGTSTTPKFVQLTGRANPFDGMDIASRSAPALAGISLRGVRAEVLSVRCLRVRPTPHAHGLAHLHLRGVADANYRGSVYRRDLDAHLVHGESLCRRHRR